VPRQASESAVVASSAPRAFRSASGHAAMSRDKPNRRPLRAVEGSERWYVMSSIRVQIKRTRSYMADAKHAVAKCSVGRCSARLVRGGAVSAGEMFNGSCAERIRRYEGAVRPKADTGLASSDGRHSSIRQNISGQRIMRAFREPAINLRSKGVASAGTQRVSAVHSRRGGF